MDGFMKNYLAWLSILNENEGRKELWNELNIVPVDGGALDALFALAAEQDETKPCTCGQLDCPFPPPISEAVFAGLKEDAARDMYDEGPRPFGIVGGEIMEFGPQRGVTQIPF